MWFLIFVLGQFNDLASECETALCDAVGHATDRRAVTRIGGTEVTGHIRITQDDVSQLTL